METVSQLPTPAELLPHGEPILQIDVIHEFVPGEYLIAGKDITDENPFLKGHFPGYPLMPGVILVEMMFQACGLYGRLQDMHEKDKKADKVRKPGKAIRINNAVFKQEVRPPASLNIHVRHSQKIFAFSVFKTEIRQGDKLVAEAELTVFI